MWGRIATYIAVGLLKNPRLSNENRQLLTTAVLDRLHAIPLRARITLDEVGTILVDGKTVKLDVAQALRKSSAAMLENFARKFVREQVTFMAFVQGVHENVTPDQGLFAKAVLWCYQEEDKLYRTFAGTELGEDE